MAETVILRTGNEYVKVTSLTGRHKRYRGVIETTDMGVRLTRRELLRAGEAIQYRRNVLARLRALRVFKN